MEVFPENSSDLEDLRGNYYKNELIMLHATLKALNRGLDLSDILKPLLAETGHAVTHVLKLARQIARMKKHIKDMEAKVQAQSPAQTSGGSGCSAAAAKSQANFLCQSPAQTSGGSAAEATSAAAPRSHPARDGASRGCGGRRRKSSPPGGIVPKEVEPAWGELRRYAVMDYATYKDAQETARQNYDYMCALERGPTFARVKDLDRRARGQITNNNLHFENIRNAAMAGDFTQIRIGYYRNEALLTAKAENNQGRRNFIVWAVAQLKARHPAHIGKKNCCKFGALFRRTKDTA